MTIRLGLRLAVAGGREGWVRFAFMIVGVGLGVALLLLALTAQAAQGSRAARSAWQDAAYAYGPYYETATPTAESADGAIFVAVSDYYDGTPMTRAYVAALGADPPVPPGLDRLPGSGEVAASPAMIRLMASTPDDQLDDRFPGRVTMTIGPAGLAHDNELVAIVGRTPDQLRGVRSVEEVRSFTVLPSGWAITAVLQALLLQGALLVLVPVIILLVTVTRASGAQRERRLAAIRLVGATRGQIAAVAAVETGIAGVGGAALGWVAYEAGRRIVSATLIFQRGHFWLADLAVAPWLLALVLLGTPALVVLITLLTLRRVQFSPLGVALRGRRRRPTAWLALPLVAGLVGQLGLLPVARSTTNEAVTGLFGLFGLMLFIGVIAIGPWLCALAAGGLARISRSVPGLLAARRIAADPWATFRAVGGIVVAAAAVTYLGSVADRTGPPPGHEADLPRPGVVLVNTGGVDVELVAPLLSPQTVTTRSGSGIMAPCADLARVTYRTCPYPAGSGPIEVPRDRIAHLPVMHVYIPTDGTLAAENRVRTQAANLVPNAIINSDRDPIDYGLEQWFIDVGRLGTVGGLFVLLVGACALTAGVIGGLVERRRPFALLRASGVRLGELRRVVVLETAATMLVTSAAGVVIGVVLAYLSTMQEGDRWTWPGPSVFVIVGTGVLAAFLFSLFALPAVGAATRHDSVRYE